MKFRILFLIIISSIFSTAYSQQTISGTVYDANNNSPLAGATITYAGKGTTTNSEGTFSLPCGKANRITVSFIGYETYQHQIKNCNDYIRIALNPSSNKLNEV
jgi:iron complex outermembrane recepter protein